MYICRPCLYLKYPMIARYQYEKNLMQSLAIQMMLSVKFEREFNPIRTGEKTNSSVPQQYSLFKYAYKFENLKVL